MARSGPCRILVVEDNPTTRKFYRVLLESEGYVVLEAGSGAAALEELGRELPDLVLQDLVLPDMGGMDLLRRTRALPGGRELPIIALSGFHRMLEEARGEPEGFDASLLKPVEVAALLQAVRTWLPYPASSASSQGKGRHVLLVDDDPLQTKLLCLQLAKAGFRVTPAADAAAALATARRDRPDVLVSDVLMPGLDGFELCSAIRRDSELSALPIVLMSAHFDGATDRALAREVGAQALVPRTPGAQKLVAILAKVLDRPSLPDGFVDEPTTPDLPPPLERVTQLKREASQAVELAARASMQAAQLAIIGGIADALARSTDTEAVLGDVLASCLDAGGVSKGALFTMGRDGRLSPLHAVGFSEEERQALPTLFDHSALLDEMSNLSQKTAVPSTLLERAGCGVGVLLSCVGDGQALGCLLLGSNLPHVTEADLVSFGRAISTYVGQAILLTRSFASLQENIEANQAMCASLDLEETLASIAKVATVRLADLCIVEVPTGRGLPDARAVLHVRAELTESVRALRAQYPDETHDTGYPSLTQAGSILSWLTLPLAGHDRVKGRLLLGRCHGRPYDERERAQAQSLAGRAAVAIDNALLCEQLRTANRLKDEFLATASHELRTPLSAVLGWARLLRSGRLPEAQLPVGLEVIERNAVAQVRLIEDILDGSRLITGRLHLEVRPHDLTDVVRTAIDTVRPAAEAKKIELVLHLDAAAAYVVGDPDRLQQMVWNLATNAIKFTPKGGRVEVRLQRVASEIHLTISDSGQGIAPDFLPHVFDRFRQADGGTTRRHGGLGLGLALVRHLAEAHGGTIQVASEGEGKGATFLVRLPVRSVRVVSSPVSPAVADGTAHAGPPQGSLAGITVLVVDDEADARELLGLTLTSHGAEVRTVGSAAAALEALRAHPPMLLVSDIGMPITDGYELIRQVRALPTETAQIPAVALTAYAREEDRRRALEAGFGTYLSKPVEPSEIVRVVERLVRSA
jgi:CheY-like chemotaxis protein